MRAHQLGTNGLHLPAAVLAQLFGQLHGSSSHLPGNLLALAVTFSFRPCRDDLLRLRSVELGVALVYCGWKS